MPMNIYSKCDACKIDRWFVRKRTYYLIPAKTTIHSVNKICSKCFKDVKRKTNTI